MSDTLSPHTKKVLRWEEFKREILVDTHICTIECKYYTRCPLAISDRNRKERPCRVKYLEDDDLNRFLTFFVFEKDVLQDEAFRILWQMAKILNVKEDAKEMQMYLDNMLKVVRAFRIDVTNSHGLDEPISINIKDFGVDNALLEPANKVYANEGLVLQEDPESLIHSATLIEKFMTNPAQTSTVRKRGVFVPNEELIRVKL